MNAEPNTRQNAELAARTVTRATAGRAQQRPAATKPLSVMKFGGTSVGDAAHIENVAEIVAGTARGNDVVVVVSAMSGVTNQLIEAANAAETGNRELVSSIFAELQALHAETANALIHHPETRTAILMRVRGQLRESESLYQKAIANKHMTPAIRDFVAGAGERASAPLVAAALEQIGVVSEAVSACELIVTDANHGSAAPRMELTRIRCDLRLRTLLRQRIVPVITGFIGATEEGVPTTLGRGGSDYSATILGAVLDANEVVIWTDVDGVLTADPKIVAEAKPIEEISYSEAADLAHFGAKVLHPKTLQPVTDVEIPVWIRNSFEPHLYGTKITVQGFERRCKVKAVTTIADAQLIAINGAGTSHLRNAIERAKAALVAARAEAWFTVRVSNGDIHIAVNAKRANRAAEMIVEEFSEELARGEIERVAVVSSVAIVTAVGDRVYTDPTVAERMLVALDREGIDLVATAERSGNCSASVVVAQRDMKAALAAIHRAFGLGETESAQR